MKMYTAQDTELTIVPSGDKFPKNPRLGAIFKLTQDMPVTHTVERWYGAGTYIYDYGIWNRINDSGRQRKAAEVASQTVMFEANPLKVRQPPKPTDGKMLAHLVMNPVNRASSYSGIATMWVEAEMDCQLVLSVFRDSKRLVAMSVEAVQKAKPRNLSVSFHDLPFTGSKIGDALSATYTLHIAADALGAVAVNRGGNQFVYDDVAPSTALIVSENT